MKSVGEVMAIGCRFEEAFQKALRMMDGSVMGFYPNMEAASEKVSGISKVKPSPKISREIEKQGPLRNTLCHDLKAEKKDGLHLGTSLEAGWSLSCMESPCRWPVLQ